MAAGGSTGVVMVALGANLAIAVAKFIAFIWTGSSAMLSEAIHSLVDTSNQALMLFGINRAQRPPDRSHPFGYSKELYFWSFIVAILLFSLGAGVALYEGAAKIQHPHPITDAHVNYIVLAVAIAVESVALHKAMVEFNRRRGDMEFFRALRWSKDPALFAILLEDIAAIIGLLVALIGVFVADYFGIAAADGMASIVIGLVLGTVATFMSIEIRSLIVGEAADPDVRDGLNAIIRTETGTGKPIRTINEIRTMHLGPEDVLVAASVDFQDGETANGVEATTARLEQAIQKRFPEVRRLYLEVLSESQYAALTPSIDAAGEHKDEPDQTKVGAASKRHKQRGASPASKAKAAAKQDAAASGTPLSRKQRKKKRHKKK